MRYEIYCETISRDPLMAACCAPLVIAHRLFDHAQPAVDAAREFVASHPGAGDLPRATVRTVGRHPRTILLVWRQPDETIHETRF